MVSVEQIIKAIIQIDRNAIKKQEEAREKIRRTQWKQKVCFYPWKKKWKRRSRKKVDAYRAEARKEIEEQEVVIRKQGEERREKLDKRYAEYADKIGEETFRMILRGMEG